MPIAEYGKIEFIFKEAIIKANGIGLYMPLDSYSIGMLNDKTILYSDKNEESQLFVERVEKDYFMATCILVKQNWS